MPTISDLRIRLTSRKLAVPLSGPLGRFATRHNLLVLVQLDDAVWGVGEVWANYPAWGPHERIQILREVIRPALVGQAIDDPVATCRMLLERTRLLGNQLGAPGPFHQAVAGTDIALWDALARSAREPLCRFIAGRPVAPSAEVYATNLLIDRPDMIEAMADRGHTRFKIKLPQDIALVERCLPAVRAAAGARPLMADAGQGYGPERLDQVLPLLTAARLDWLEEPFGADDEAAYLHYVGRRDRPPLAMGENSIGEDGFDRLTRTIRPEVVQPDITKTGGISLGREFAVLASARGARVCLHMYGGPVGLLASAHLAAAEPSIAWVEMDHGDNPLFDTLPRPLVVRDGALELPPGPGIGIDIGRLTARSEDVTAV